MGCYNGTCMVTNLPITYQQDVVAYLVLYRTQNKIPTGPGPALLLLFAFKFAYVWRV